MSTENKQTVNQVAFIVLTHLLQIHARRRNNRELNSIVFLILGNVFSLLLSRCHHKHNLITTELKKHLGNIQNIQNIQNSMYKIL